MRIYRIEARESCIRDPYQIEPAISAGDWRKPIGRDHIGGIDDAASPLVDVGRLLDLLTFDIKGIANMRSAVSDDAKLRALVAMPVSRMKFRGPTIIGITVIGERKDAGIGRVGSAGGTSPLDDGIGAVICGGDQCQQQQARRSCYYAHLSKPASSA